MWHQSLPLIRVWKTVYCVLCAKAVCEKLGTAVAGWHLFVVQRSTICTHFLNTQKYCKTSFLHLNDDLVITSIDKAGLFAKYFSVNFKRNSTADFFLRSIDPAPYALQLHGWMYPLRLYTVYEQTPNNSKKLQFAGPCPTAYPRLIYSFGTDEQKSYVLRYLKHSCFLFFSEQFVQHRFIRVTTAW